MSSREIMRRLEDAGWYVARIAGSHHVFKHPNKPGRVVLAHPRKDCPPGTLRAIERQSGVRLR
ncbi:MAG: addiction module toxin, HicA family [Alphaproteobacteria bacterium]|nr:addiction module toxin, HicA family [Alphaproteobacteria bacterium]